MEAWRSLCVGRSYAGTRPSVVSALNGRRHESTTSIPPTTSSVDNILDHEAVLKLRNKLTESQPCFAARGDEVEVLFKPVDFHERLLQMIARARRRIIISTLYIGVEQGELVEALRSALTNQPHLRVTLISDLLRSTRETYPSPSTASLLLPLVEEFPDRVEAWFYRSPNLRGLLERIVPRRFDEGWGLWHCKWYGADDEVLLTGANLSSSYFTNRQDRYYHLKNQATMLSYLQSIMRLYSSYSYRLLPNPPPSSSPKHHIPLQPGSKAALVWPEPYISPRGFSLHANATLTAFQKSWRDLKRGKRVDADTYFWPMIQGGVLNMREEEASLDKVFKMADEMARSDDGVRVDLTSGYFGLYKKYKRALLESSAPYHVVAASPQANGFYKSPGISKLIPDAYTLLETRFHRDLVRSGREWDEGKAGGVELAEWMKEGWTYHAKGIWLSPKDQANEKPQPPRPYLTFIGSSNLSTRSLNLDVELSFLMMTSSNTLRKAMSNEVQNVRENSKAVGPETWKQPDRTVGLTTKVLVALGVEGML